MRGFIRGVKDIGHLIAHVEPELEACKGMEEQVKRLKGWDGVFFNPETLAMTLWANSLAHHAALMKNVYAIENDIKTK